MMKITNWITGKKLGTGSFATVYEAHHKDDPSKIVAIKVMDMNRLLANQKDEKAFLRLAQEIQHQMSCKSPHTVSLIEVFTSAEYLYLVMELCWGDLSSLLRAAGGSFSEAITLRFMKHLALGLRALHDNQIVHRDLKPQNLLVVAPPGTPPGALPDLSRCCIKISDFGFARVLDDTTVTGTLCGSPLYMAPEILTQGTYNSKADLWSAGAIMMEMLTGKQPYPCRTFQEIIQTQHQQRNRPVPVPASLRAAASPGCIDLLEGLLEKSAVKRISFSEFFDHPWLDLMADLLASVVADQALLASPSLAPGPSPSSSAPAQGAAASLDAELLEALRSIERALPVDEEHPAQSDLFEAGPSSLTGANLSKIIWRITSLSQEYRQLKEEAKRPRIILRDLRIGDRAMFTRDKHGNYTAFGNFLPLHVLSVDSVPAFAHQIAQKMNIFGVVIEIEPAVVTQAGNPYMLPPGTEYIAVTLASDPFDGCLPHPLP